jgi:gliding motility-associated-like protein
MKTLKNALAVCLLLVSISGLTQNLSNKGTDFWVGYGHHQFMEPGQNNSQEMVLYFAAEQAATVTVSIWGTTWTRTYNVAAGSVIASDLIPKAGAIDARLISLPCSFVPPGTPCGGEGVFSNKAIHITSTTPIVAYAHIYGSASSGATMLMPTEAWGYAYTSVNSKQDYAANCFSWMYVIATHDNTVVEVTPTVATRGGRQPGIPYIITLNKGQIYQTMGGPETGSAKSEMTGTKLKSIANSNGQCFPVAVFSGSSRTTNPASCGSGGGDNDNQQLFPSVAWGKRYLTAPTSSSTNAANKMRNIYKVVVKDPSTIVKVNGSQLSPLLANSYYIYESNTEDYIEADQPIMVAQFMNGASSCLNGGNGDPEMIIISPLEQGIKRIGFYRNRVEAITTNYLTLIIPTAGVSSLRIDGSNTFDHTYPHSKLPGYTVVVKRWSAAAAQSTAFSDSAFTAITYGLGSVESYGYNAGTMINNLAVQGEVYNVADPSLADAVRKFTCKGTPMQISALVGYKPTNMLWRLSQIPSISPNADVNIANPIPVDSIVVGLGKYYRYELPGTYMFNDTGTFYLPIVNSEPTIENCTRTEEVKIPIVVKPNPFTNLSINHTGCLLDTVHFSSSVNGGNGHAVNNWAWDLGDGTVSSQKDTAKLYAAPGTYTIKLHVTTPEGCIGDTTRTVTIGNKPVASIVVTPPGVCEGTPVVFSDTTTTAASGIWYWNFGNNTTANLTSNTPQTVTYATPNTYTVKHVVKTSATCVSDTVTAQIVVFAKPAKPIVASPAAYCQGGQAVALTASVLAGHTSTWYNNSSLTGGTTAAPVPSTTTLGTTYYYVTQTNSNGCVSDTARIEVVVTPALANNTITADQTVCSGSPAAILNGSTPTGGTNSYSYQWQQSTNSGAVWTDIPGATSPTYNPGILSTGITKFRRVVLSGLCSSNSNEVNIEVQTNLMNYDISASQTICEGTAPALLDGQAPTGGTTTYSFEWQVSANGTTWTVIPGATSEDFQPGPLSVKTYYRRITTGGNCPAISSVVTININPTANGTISGPASICEYNGGAVIFNATAGAAPFSIELLVTAPGGATTPITQTVTNNGPQSIPVILVNSTPGIYTVTLQSVSDNGGCVRTTGFTPVQISVTATPALVFNPVTPTICAGSSVNLNVSGASTYTWSPATGLSTTSGTSVSVNATQTTTYTVTGTSNGCNGTGTITVTVNPLPAKPVVSSPVIYCQNGTATALSATALPGHTLTWYNNGSLTGGTATAPTPSTAAAGTTYYYVTQQSSNNCPSDTARIAVVVTEVISNNTISAAQTVCAGVAAANLDGAPAAGGTGTYSYQWQQSTDGGATWTNITNGTIASYSPGVLPAGVYQFRRVVTSGLCTNTSNVISVTVEMTLTNYEISGAQTVCEGVVPALLDGQAPSGGTGTYAYQWESSADGVTWSNIAGAANEDYQPTALSATTYFRRTASGGNCPAISAPVIITVNPTPGGSITAPSGICSYQTAEVVFTPSTGTAPYTIQLQITAPGGGTSTITQTINSNNTPVAFNVIPLNSAAGNYTVQLTSVTDSKGCTRTTGFTALNILVTAQPTVTVNAGANPICEGSSTTLTAGGATTYAWTPTAGLNTATGSAITANPVTTTSYQVTGTTNGCTNTATIDLTVIPRPAKPVVNNNTVTYCQDATAGVLTATALSGHTLTWYNNAALTGGAATAPTPSTATPGTFTYYVTQTNSSGCVSDASVITVAINPLPTVLFDLPAGVCMPNGTAVFTNKSTIPANAAMTYSWNFGDQSPLATTRDGSHVYATSGSYNITLTTTSSAGCIASDTKTFSAFFEKPVANFTVSPAALCQGQDNFFTDLSDPMGSTITKWEWLFGDGQSASAKNPTHRYSQPGAYTVKLIVTTAIGCVSDTFSYPVTVYLQPKIDAGPSFVVPEGTTVQFKATANDTATVSLSWSPVTGLSNPTTLQPSITATQNQTYTLTAVGQGNCTAVDNLTVRILKPIQVPNAFSPNGDGINDRWMIPNLADYPGAKVEIFNRWGQPVFTSYGYNTPWDGSYLGKPLPLATYYYVITLNNGFKPVTGSITIIK